MKHLLVVLLLLSGCFGGSSLRPTDYIGDSYDNWVIEIDYVDGHRPTATALNHMKAQLSAIVKPTVSYTIDDRVPGRESWGVGDLQDYQDKYQDQKTKGNTVVTYMLVVNGEFRSSNGNGALGVTIGHDLIGIFDESIADACTITRGCLFANDDVLKAVLTHEMGHAIGLVNRGIAMVNDHEDPEHPKHSDNPNSVMYWAVDSTLALGGLDNLPTTFDADDKADVCNAGGKGC